MEITNNLLSITPMYIAIFAILFVPLTMRVGIYRGKKKILLGYGEDEKLNTLIHRCHTADTAEHPLHLPFLKLSMHKATK